MIRRALVLTLLPATLFILIGSIAIINKRMAERERPHALFDAAASTPAAFLIPDRRVMFLRGGTRHAEPAYRFVAVSIGTNPARDRMVTIWTYGRNCCRSYAYTEAEIAAGSTTSGYVVVPVKSSDEFVEVRVRRVGELDTDVTPPLVKFEVSKLPQIKDCAAPFADCGGVN